MRFVDLIVCPDCQAYLCSDHSVFDYWYGLDKSESMIEQIANKVDEMMEEKHISFITEKSEVFEAYSHSPCDCCNTRLGGYRFKISASTESEVTRDERKRKQYDDVQDAIDRGSSESPSGEWY